MHRLNTLLDRLPRARVRLGDRTFPTYLVCGLTGVTAGAMSVAAVAVPAGRGVGAGLAACSTACVVFVAYDLLRRRLTGAETTVLLEHFAVVLPVTALGLAIAGAPVLATLDLLTVGLSVFLVFGRVGCTLAGCCYGVASGVGIRYPEECGHPSAIRRFPVQIVEIAAWLALSLLGGALAIAGQPGDALAAVLVVYGLARFALESLRDDPRPRLGPTTSTRVLAALAVLAGSAVHDLRDGGAAWLVVVALALAGALVASRGRWHTPPPEIDLGGLRRAGAELAAEPPGAEVRISDLGLLRVGASQDGSLLTLSVSRRGGGLSRAEAGLAFEHLLRGLAVPRPDEVPVTGGRRGVFVVVLRIRQAPGG